MSFNVRGAVQIPLELFGGLVTESPAQNVPAGVSPDCQDVIFRPGAVGGRPALNKVFATPFGSVTVTYAKSYIDKKGVFRNLFLDSAGNLWVEDVTNSAGSVTLLATTTPGSYAKSITAFGREYVAISDGLHGSEVPLQYDGVNLDRVTQDGPGGPPNIANLSIPPVNMVLPTGPGALTITSATTTDLVGGFYTTLTITVTSGASSGMAGDIVTIAGNTNGALNTTFSVLSIPDDNTIIANIYSATLETGTGGTASIATAFALQRSNNIVTVNTATAHQLQVGYQAQISGVPAGPVDFVSTIVINNVDNPGIATVTLPNPHGLASGEVVIIDQVAPVAVGGTISSLSRQGGVVTAITTGANGLKAGVTVNIVSPTNGTFAGTFTVFTVNTLSEFTYLQTDADATSSAGGTVTINWPLPALSTPSLFEVLAIPTSKSFQIALNYADVTWTSGAVWFPWDGTFYVSMVISPTSFQYKQMGPDDSSTVGGSPATGKVTPFGQVAPGKHQMQVLYETRQGYVTAPSPPVLFDANGAQYLAVSNIPIGPDNVVARILAFTGADGAYFFYIPATPTINGQVVGTSTRIADNTTTSVVLDFSDNTLFSSLGISIPGNNLANQIVLDGALGFGLFAERLITYGQRNRVLNFLNLGFDGGAFPATPTIPTGWTVVGAGGGALAAGHYGQGWQFSGSGHIEQGAFLDAYGAPILTGNTQYTLRAWISGIGATATVTLVGGSPAFSITATLTGVSATGSWVEADFSGKTPASISPDTVMQLAGTGGGLIDEISIIFTDVPYVQGMYGSYVNNPEGFDGVSGFFGPADDTRAVLATGIIRSTLFILTRDPAGRLHSVQNSGTSEPAGWTVNEVAAMCGVLSAYALTVSQADDATAGGGEEWMAWMSASGARLFGGDQPWKISQEIQPDWDAINAAAYLTCWALNDPATRRIYFGLPKGLLATSSPVITSTAPNKIYHFDYKELDGAYEIAQSPPVHVTFTGKLAARDHARKWAPWNLSINGAAQIYRAAGGQLTTVLLAGNGQFPNSVDGGFGNVYTICKTSLVDDDYGLMKAYYFTYAFSSAEQEQSLQLGGQRHLLQYLQWDIVGDPTLTMTVTPYPNSLSNPWPIGASLPLRADPLYDDEWGGGNAQGQRIFLKFEVNPS